MGKSAKRLELNELIKSLRSIPFLDPPTYLTQRIMDALRPQAKQRMVPLVKYSAHEMNRKLANRTKYGILPCNPSELGLLFLCFGAFFLFLSTVSLFLVQTGGALSDKGSIFWFLPALAASILLILAGCFQIKSPVRIIQQRSRLVVSSVLFAMTMVAGAFLIVAPGPKIVVTWIGASGLLVAGTLILVQKLPLQGVGEC